MNIYFVNKNSSIKGPFDIMDAHRNRIMKIGDVCLRENDNGVSFLLVVNDENRWNACKQIGFANGNLGLEGNALLFSFNGVSKRFGNLKECETLCELFEEDPLHSFFINAVDILSYKCDLWDISIFSRILSLSPIEMPTIVKQEPMVYNKEFTQFECYLPVECQSLFTSLSVQGKSLREIYIEIRSKYPNDFRQALKNFLKENPNKTIYDR